MRKGPSISILKNNYCLRRSHRHNLTIKIAENSFQFPFIIVTKANEFTDKKQNELSSR